MPSGGATWVPVRCDNGAFGAQNGLLRNRRENYDSGIQTRENCKGALERWTLWSKVLSPPTAEQKAAAKLFWWVEQLWCSMVNKIHSNKPRSLRRKTSTLSCAFKDLLFSLLIVFTFKTTTNRSQKLGRGLLLKENVSLCSQVNMPLFWLGSSSEGKCSAFPFPSRLSLRIYPSKCGRSREGEWGCVCCYHHRYCGCIKSWILFEARGVGD